MCTELTSRTPQRIAVIGVASGLGAGNRGCEEGAEALQFLDALRDLNSRRHPLEWTEVIHHTSVDGLNSEALLAEVHRITSRLGDSVEEQLRARNFPLVVGGDHSCAIGTWSGVRGAFSNGQPGRIGLIWIDAHMDSHTRRTSPSQNLHGMPLACLLGHGEPRFSQLRGPAPVLKAEDVCLVGVRSFEWGEAELLLNLGVRIYFMDEIKKRGLQEVLTEARDRVTRSTSRFGISIDLDSLDPTEVPGVGTPVADGLHTFDLARALHDFHNDSRLAALEIVEYNPYNDINAKTAGAIHDLACSILGDEAAA